jgi:predicted nucleic acid-binding protein
VRIALDTNIIVYAEGVRRADGDELKHSAALRLIGNMAEQEMCLSIQALAELHSVLVRKGGIAPTEASSRVRLWASRAELIETDAALFQQSLDFAAAHGLQIFDAIILVGAGQAGCELLLSEDLHGGFVWRNLTVSNPFGANPDPRLIDLLA